MKELHYENWKATEITNEGYQFTKYLKTKH